MRMHLWLAMALAALLSARVTLACEVSSEVRAALDQRDFVEAERLAKAAVANEPNSVQPRLELAHVYGEWSRRPDAKGQPSLELDPARSAQAVAILDEVVKRWPTTLQPHICLLELRQLRKETEPFFAALDETLLQFPDPSPKMVESLEFLLRRFLDVNLDGSGERMCRKLVARQDITVPLLSNCGLSSMRQQDLEAALERFRRAHNADEKDALVVHNLATAQILVGDLAAAASSLSALDALDPNDPWTALERAVVATARDPGSSAPDWRRAAARAEKRAGAAEAKAVLDFAHQTLAALEKPGAVGGSSLAAMARALMSSDATLAAALAEGAAARAPSDPSFPYLLAQALEANKLDRRALAALEHAAKLPSAKSDALDIPPGAIDFEAGRLATKVGRYADAVTHLERARGAHGDFPNLDYLLGRAYEGFGDIAAARRAYQDCLVHPNDADYTDWCRKNGDRLASAPAAPAAVSDFERALAQARANESSAAGREYTPASTAALGPRLAAAFDSCLALLPSDADSAARTLLVRVAADGSVAEVLLGDEGRERSCFASQLRGAKAPAPPAVDWWLVYDVKIQP